MGQRCLNVCLSDRIKTFTFIILAWLVSSLTAVWAAESPGVEIQRRQAIQLEQAQRKSSEHGDTLRAPQEISNPEKVVLAEPECFQINAISWKDAEDFDWLEKESSAFIGRCLGTQSLARLRDHLTLALLNKGYITSRVYYPEQNLRQGTLTIQVIPGRLSSIIDQGEPAGHTWFALASHPGSIINQRDLDQSLENFRQLNSRSGTSLEIIPGANLGESSLLIKHAQTRPWQGRIGLDNGGSKSTGEYQISANLSLDSIFGIYDNLTLSGSTNANYEDPHAGNHTAALQWSVPIGYAALALGMSQSDYKNTVSGYVAPIEYTGNNQTYDISIGYTSYRASDYKGHSQIKLTQKKSQNLIDGINIEVQERNLLNWELSHQHRQRLAQWSTTLNLAIRASLPGQSSHVGIIVGQPDWDGYYRISTATAHATHDFLFYGNPMRYQTQMRWQHSHTQIPSSENISIGGRHSVRGFDDESSLSSGSGGYWRNDLGVTIFDRHEMYLALDAGEIAGEQAESASSRKLVGIATGWRGSVSYFSYEMSIGKPLVKPDYFSTQPSIAGTLSIQI